MRLLLVDSGCSPLIQSPRQSCLLESHSLVIFSCVFVRFVAFACLLLFACLRTYPYAVSGGRRAYLEHVVRECVAAGEVLLIARSRAVELRTFLRVGVFELQVISADLTSVSIATAPTPDWMSDTDSNNLFPAQLAPVQRPHSQPRVHTLVAVISRESV